MFGDRGPMAVARMKCQDKRMSDKDKAERLAARLRDNLRRRKQQARQMENGGPQQKDDQERG